MFLENYVRGIDESEESLCEDPTNGDSYAVQAACFSALR